MDYHMMLRLANEHHYSHFTDLQECAFRTPETYDNNKNLFVVGETSSGKTLIPLLIYAAKVREAVMNHKRYPKMLFVVPYRALAAQKLKEFSEFFKGQGLKIIQSTGEFRQDDDAVRKGEVHIAIVITEKVYKYEARDSNFLSMYDYLVLDEIGLLGSVDRGLRLDFIFAWAYNQKTYTGKPRTITLGTPFYNWNAYINGYGFHLIRSNKKRPVKLVESHITYNKHEIKSVEGASKIFLGSTRMLTKTDICNLNKSDGIAKNYCTALECECAIMEPARTNRSKSCPINGKKCVRPIEFVPNDCGKGASYLLVKICRKHLMDGHQILVFVNDRERVKQYCSLLYRQLKDLLPDVPSGEKCKQEILEMCELDGEDVFGIMEDENASAVELEFYQAFKSGIGFHSAALPNELRTYVEDKLLNSREMKIVCSTETLAFGVNSSVDVVVVADLIKHSSMDLRPLTANEYRNYAGRAGRLRPELNTTRAKGYVYTLISTKQTPFWEELLKNASAPECLYSRFYTDDGQKIAFFLMNLLPSNGSDGMTISQLAATVCALPQNGTHTIQRLEKKVRNAMKLLIQHELAVRMDVVVKKRGMTWQQEQYCLTRLGNQLRGFILNLQDYRLVLEALDEYVSDVFLDSNKTTFLYRLLKTQHAENHLNSIFSGSETRWTLSELQNYIQLHTPGRNNRIDWLYKCRDERTLSILAAILAWSEGESAKTLYRQFGIHYALLSKTAEQLAYLIEIAAEILPFRLNQLWIDNQETYQRLHMNNEDFICQMSSKIEEIHKLFVSVYFGINIPVTEKLLNYLNDTDAENADQDSDALAFAQDISFRMIDAKSARVLRRIAVRYKFFETPQRVNPLDVITYNNYTHQRWQYKKDIARMKPFIGDFFRSTLGEKYTD